MSLAILYPLNPNLTCPRPFGLYKDITDPTTFIPLGEPIVKGQEYQIGPNLNYTYDYLSPNLEVKIPSSGYKTFASDRAYLAPISIKVYGVLAKKNQVLITNYKARIIPANVGVLLGGTANTTVSLRPIHTTVENIPHNHLVRPSATAQGGVHNGLQFVGLTKNNTWQAAGKHAKIPRTVGMLIVDVKTRDSVQTNFYHQYQDYSVADIQSVSIATAKGSAMGFERHVSEPPKFTYDYDYPIINVTARLTRQLVKGPSMCQLIPIGSYGISPLKLHWNAGFINTVCNSDGTIEISAFGFYLKSIVYFPVDIPNGYAYRVIDVSNKGKFNMTLGPREEIKAFQPYFITEMFNNPKNFKVDKVHSEHMIEFPSSYCLMGMCSVVTDTTIYNYHEPPFYYFKEGKVELYTEQLFSFYHISPFYGINACCLFFDK